MTSNELRTSFLGFFNGKKHEIVTSAPIVIKEDPTLMFTNAGMNQFKDIFLGSRTIKYTRVANSQKCLRVSGKHNDLEEVGHDTYHHTMFEMLGNWSFGDYFKKEAIEWAWEYLVNILKIDGNRLYATVFEGDEADHLKKDEEAYNYWMNCLPKERILNGSKKDNFWEMGETGPCGPCSEIHIDLRDDSEMEKTSGRDLVNKDHPQVIEIWNLVFIQYNRKSDGTLEKLANKHIDTGMGFERLCMVVQGKRSNYDTDVFQPILREIALISGINYGEKSETDVAMRVAADHLRAVAFSIADGQIPSNNKGGYVIRRILRRAVRYGYSFLNQEEPFIYALVPVLVNLMGGAYPELVEQKEFIQKVIKEEEQSFLRTLANGMKMLEGTIQQALKKSSKNISGRDVFTLYDTYGFPVDLTRLILKEHQMSFDAQEFQDELQKQKNRSKEDAKLDTGDWVIVQDKTEDEFVGYKKSEVEIKIIRYRKVIIKDKTFYHLVFNKTPFYAESGGQVGDSGTIETNRKRNGSDRLSIINTIKENNQHVHISIDEPRYPKNTYKAIVDIGKRKRTESNHSATHLLHFALRKVLGNHVEQRGSLVHPDYLRFDFSHFSKMTEEEIRKVELMVNEFIRKNIGVDEKMEMSYQEAMDMGAMALFGEKYGDKVRVIKFGDSVELCGGTHVENTASIGLFKIIKETAIAAGIRRIEAITNVEAEKYINQKLDLLKEIEDILKNQKDPKKAVEDLLEENNKLQKRIEEINKQRIRDIKEGLKNNLTSLNGFQFIAEIIQIENGGDLKDIAFQLKGEVDKLILVLGAVINDKPQLAIMLSDEAVKEKDLNASSIVKDSAKHIDGGGGGQAFFATAGGKKPNRLSEAVKKAEELVRSAF